MPTPPRTGDKALSKMTRDLMEDVKRADATVTMMQEEIGKLRGVPDGQQG